MNKKPFIKIFLRLIACVGILLAAGCGKAASSELPEQIPTPEATLTITEAITMTATPSPTNTPIPTATATPIPTVTPTPTLSPTPTLVPVYDQILKLESETEADPELPVKAALLVNISDSTVLYSDHATEVIYPASITKLMTALVVLDAEQDLTEMVQISKTAVTPVIPSAKMCGFKAGDFILYIDLLRSMLVYSGNDTSVALAEYMVGSEADFVALMNQKAEELGLRSSVFCNSHGLPDDNHVTSAYDIYLIMQKLFNFEEFLGIIESGSIEVEVLRGESIKTFHFESTNQFFTDKYQMPEGITMIGGKTGNTNKAGYCLALYVKDQSGDCYIAEIFGAKSREELFPSMIQLLTHISEE